VSLPTTSRVAGGDVAGVVAGVVAGDASGIADGVVDRVVAGVLERPATLGRTRLVCVDGGAGSGKTTLAARLEHAFRTALGDGARVETLHMDDVYEGWDGVAEGRRTVATSVIEPLRRGVPGRYRRWDWHRDAYAEQRVVEPVDVLVVEGVGSGNSAYDDVTGCLVWVAAPPAVRLERGLARDGEHMRERWLAFRRAEEAMFAREGTRERADLVMDGVGGDLWQGGDMVMPSGEQYEITGGGYRAVVTECGAALRVLEQDGRPLLLGFAEDEMPWAGRGQLLVPWPNRLRDGRYSFDGRDLQLPLTEPSLGNASHGLVRWVAWTLEERTAHSVSQVYRLMAQTGYPWTVDVHVLHDLSADGLTVTVTATNLSASPAPYAMGSHPYLTTGTGPVDGWELTLPASTRLVSDDRKIPVGREDVRDGDLDFRVARPLRSTSLDTAFTDLDRDRDGRVEVSLHDPARDEGVTLWMDAAHRWVQVYTGDDLPRLARQSLAVEPMTAPPNALATGEDVVVLAPAGAEGDELSASWGIRSL
jgi:aldose 1-epimerase